MPKKKPRNPLVRPSDVTIDGQIPVYVPTPEELLADVLISRECCTCDQKLALAALLADGVVPALPANYVVVDAEGNPL